jgi:hypothetical protein
MQKPAQAAGHHAGFLNGKLVEKKKFQPGTPM